MFQSKSKPTHHIGTLTPSHRRRSRRPVCLLRSDRSTHHTAVPSHGTSEIARTGSRLPSPPSCPVATSGRGLSHRRAQRLGSDPPLDPQRPLLPHAAHARPPAAPAPCVAERWRGAASPPRPRPRHASRTRGHGASRVAAISSRSARCAPASAASRARARSVIAHWKLSTVACTAVGSTCNSGARCSGATVMRRRVASSPGCGGHSAGHWPSRRSGSTSTSTCRRGRGPARDVRPGRDDVGGRPAPRPALDRLRSGRAIEQRRAPRPRDAGALSRHHVPPLAAPVGRPTLSRPRTLT